MNFKSLKLKPTPNQYLLAPEGLCEEDAPHRTARVYDIGGDELARRLLRVIRGQPRIEERRHDAELNQYEFVQRTALLGFPDTITVQFLALGPRQSSLAIYSRSRYGYSDLGANKARVEKWLDALERDLREN